MQSKVTSGRLDKRQLNQTSKPLPAPAVTFLTVTVTNTVSEINGQLKRCPFLTFFTKTSSAADPYFGAVSLKVTISKLLQAVCVAQCTTRAFSTLHWVPFGCTLFLQIQHGSVDVSWSQRRHPVLPACSQKHLCCNTFRAETVVNYPCVTPAYLQNERQSTEQTAPLDCTEQAINSKSDPIIPCIF